MTRPRVPVELRRRPFTLEQARQAGISDRQLQGGPWLRIGPQTYVWAGLEISPEVRLQAALHRLPSAALFCGLTAGWLHGLDVEPCKPIQVVVPPGAGVSIRAGIAVSRALVPAGDAGHCRGFRVTGPVRTVADLGRQLPSLVEATVVVDMALHANLVTLEGLRAWAAANPGGRGLRQLRRALVLAEPASESPMETRLRLLLVLGGLPTPQSQVNLAERGRLLGRADLYYPEARLIIEYDGSGHRHQLEADNRRQNALLTAGHRLLRFTAADVLHTPDATVAQVRAALGRGAHAGPATSAA